MLVLIGLVVFYFAPALFYVTWFALSHHVHVDAKHADQAFPADVQLIAQVITYLPVAIYLLVALPLLARGSLASLGIRRPSARDLVTGVAGAGAMWVVTSALSALVEAVSHQKSTEAAIALLSSLTTEAEKIVFVVVAVVLAPLIEELMFRVFLLNAIRRYSSAGVAVVVSGILFGLVHATGGGQLLSVAIPLAGSGLVLGAVYVRTGNYWASVTTHALFNATNVIALVFFGAK